MVRIHQGKIIEGDDVTTLSTEIDFGKDDKREVLISVAGEYGKFSYRTFCPRHEKR